MKNDRNGKTRKKGRMQSIQNPPKKALVLRQASPPPLVEILENGMCWGQMGQGKRLMPFAIWLSSGSA